MGGGDSSLFSFSSVIFFLYGEGDDLKLWTSTIYGGEPKDLETWYFRLWDSIHWGWAKNMVEEVWLSASPSLYVYLQSKHLSGPYVPLLSE